MLKYICVALFIGVTIESSFQADTDVLGPPQSGEVPSDGDRIAKYVSSGSRGPLGPGNQVKGSPSPCGGNGGKDSGPSPKGHGHKEKGTACSPKGHGHKEKGTACSPKGNGHKGHKGKGHKG
ncbi:collagen alpha-1(IX) chain-like isoform X2 [Leptidea sinapis]|uniref:collagen alpha-1(IX) chain-like isoform X2 n=1 Tax=Leptidea sinapis TaxID=189913 RepID=UPI0021C37DF7|nr:collagen alpha-1(IX) chain-like isoform X2 [Leptidea sinapis]